MNKTIYHYTDSNALISILTNKTLWMNDVQFMNDRDEILDSIKILKSLRESYPDNHSLASFAEYANYDNPVYAELGVPNIQSLGFMITSFCRESDILEMWRGYGNSGQKYCIGFDRDVLLECSKRSFENNELTLTNCIYEDDVKREKLSEMFNPGDKESEDLYTRLLSIKNEGFKNEQEVRLIGCFSFRNKSQSESLKHRSSSMGIVPYREIQLCQIDDRPLITEIMIGPTDHKAQCYSAVESLIHKSFYLNQGKKNLFNKPEQVQINHSRISYRR